MNGFRERMHVHVEEVRKHLHAFQDDAGQGVSRKLDLEKEERLLNRMADLEPCDECESGLMELGEEYKRLRARLPELEKSDVRSHRKVLNKLLNHVHKVHKVVPQNYYIGVFMPLGLTFGMLIGLGFLENMVYGFTLGISIGIAIGAGLDAKSKKDGLTF